MTVLQWLLLVGIFGGLGLFALAVHGNWTSHVSLRDLDELTCQQMREQGWAEGEIRQFMDKNCGYYSKPDSTGGSD